MSNFAFFIESSARLSGEQIQLLNLAIDLALDKNNKVYYINNLYSEDLEYIGKSDVIISDINSFDFSNLENATILVPINYLFFLLTKLENKIKSAKILLWAYDSGALNRFFNQNQKKVSITACLSLFKKRDSLAFSNRLFYYNCCTKYGIFKENYLPLSYLSLSETVKNSHLNKLASNYEINIGYVGNIGAIDARIIENLAVNIIASSIQQKVNIHIIGEGSGQWRVDFNRFTPYIRFVYPGKLTDADILKYLEKNVDLVVAYKENAVFAASLKMPTILPIVSATQKDNRYVHYFNVNDFLYKWDRNELLFTRNTNCSIKSVLRDIYINNKKMWLATKCYDAFQKNNSSNVATYRFLCFARSCKLTYKDCISNNFIRAQLKAYRDTLQDFNSLSYLDFYSKKVVDNKSKNGRLSKLKAKLDIKRILKSLQAHRNKVAELRKFQSIQKSYPKKINAIRKKQLNGEKIKVGFILVFKSVFPGRPVFEKMLTDACFDPYIIVVPNVSRSMRYQRNLFEDTYNSLFSCYGDRVIAGYNIDKDEYLELNDDYNILFFCNPYKHLVHPYHEIKYFIDKNVLSVYSSYGFAALSFWNEVIATDFYNYLWKACVETESNLTHLKEVAKIKGINGIVTGYIKADSLATIIPSPKNKKRILICPHHTVWGWKTLNISNFLTYADLFINLPKLFPDVDFVFRPHPLLLANLKAHKIWTQQQIDNYFDKLLSNDNMIYDTSGDYYQQFADSDAMIHDCGSFIGEYLYTENPCCYMIKSKEETYKGLVPLGQQCMDQHYHAMTEKDIIDFIQNVVIEGDDPMKEQREIFVEQELKANYPYAAQTTIAMIKKELKLK